MIRSRISIKKFISSSILYTRNSSKSFTFFSIITTENDEKNAFFSLYFTRNLLVLNNSGEYFFSCYSFCTLNNNTKKKCEKNKEKIALKILSSALQQTVRTESVASQLKNVTYIEFEKCKCRKIRSACERRKKNAEE